MKFLMALVFSFSFAYSAEYKDFKTKYTIQTRTDFGSQVFYNCDSVENRVERLLETLGAKNISVRCTGGLDMWGNFHLPARVTAKYSALSNEMINSGINTELVEEKVKERNSCHLLNTSFNKLRKNFLIDSYKVRRCTSSNTRSNIRFTVLKEI